MKKIERLGYLFKIISRAVAVCLLALFQISFIAILPWPLNYFNLILSTLIFITTIFNFSQALWFALFAGLIIDEFSFSGFGTMAAILIIVATAINFLFRNFFTNRSLYSLVILGLIGNGVYILSLLIFNFLFFILGAAESLEKFFSYDNIWGLGWQMIFNVLFLTIIFLALNFLSKKLKSVFIDAS